MELQNGNRNADNSAPGLFSRKMPVEDRQTICGPFAFIRENVGLFAVLAYDSSLLQYLQMEDNFCVVRHGKLPGKFHEPHGLAR